MRGPRGPALQGMLWGGLLLALIGVIGAGAWSLVRTPRAGRGLSQTPSPRLPVYGLVPDFSLIDRSGRAVSRSEFLGKIWIVNFIYTQCPDTCALQSAEMARLQADLRAEPDLRLVSITIDPERDTPQVLSRYAGRFGANPERWWFLTGEKELIYRFAREGLRLPVIDPGSQVRGRGRAIAGHAGGGARVLHTSRFVLVDRRARIRGYYESADAESLQRLRQDLTALLREE